MSERAEQIERLTQQLSDRVEEIQQLRTDQEQLEQKLEETKGEYEVLLGRRDREHEEDNTMNSMLQADLDKAKQER